MSIAANTRSAMWIWSGIAASGAVLIGGLYAGDVIGPRGAAPELAGDESVSTATSPRTSTEAADAALPVEEKAATAAQANAAPSAPRIDIFRLEPDGTALVAGRAAPGWQVVLMLDGQPLATALPGADGAFARFIEVPASAEPRVLSLRMTQPEGDTQVAGETEIIIAPVRQPVPDTRIASTAGPVPEASSAERQDAKGNQMTATASAPATRPAEFAATDLPGALGAAADQPPPDLARQDRTAPDLHVDTAAQSPAATPGGADAIAARPVVGPISGPISGPVSGLVSDPGAVPAGGAASAPASAPVSGPAPGSAGAEPAASRPAVLMADAAGVRVLQSPVSAPAAAPQVMSTVSLEAISYSGDGDVQVSGRAVGTGFVRVYLDNMPITTSRVAEAGTWRTDLSQVDTGIYTLRIDEISPSGTVTSRIETPFKREDPGLLAKLRSDAAAPDAPSGTEDPAAGGQQSGEQSGQQSGQHSGTKSAAASIRMITVQPGNTLWAISRDTYGEGLLYVRVFEANADRIRDPDLIYPGQVFTLPR